MAIIKDIETSSLTELNIWSTSLGLSTSTNIDSLKNNLAKYYKVTLTKRKSVQGKVITINRAEISKYYTVESVDESIAEFEGRVEILIDDTEKKIQHSIVADKVNFNRTLNSVTALGNVEYIKTEQGKPELVTADSLTFNLSNWKGSLLKCISQQDKEINEESMVFYYVTGEIKKSDTNVMGMSDVTVQTVLGSPYFNISATDLWMLDSSDFIIMFPFIKVGHVPIFWAPFYYHSENNLYFNPVYGVKSREGTTLQNTMYIIGQKTANSEESDFSFLSFDNGEASNNQEFDGLTLVPSEDKSKYSSDFSKIMIDYYSNLGIFLGNETELTNKKSKTELSLSGGLGFSRNINTSNGDIFENRESTWNSSYIFNTQVPFRYMLYLNLKSPLVTLDLKALSDSYFRTDFLNREENFQWVDYFTNQLDDGIETLSANSDTTTYDRDTTNESLVTTYKIGADFAKFSPKVDSLNPYITAFSLDFEEIELTYNSKVAKNVTVSDTGTITKTNAYKSWDPSYKFFFPEELEIPLTLKLSGKLFDTSSRKKSDTSEEKPDKKYEYSDPLFKIENPTKTAGDSGSDIESNSSESNIYDINYRKSFTDEKITNTTKSTSEVFLSDLSYTIKAPLNIFGYWDDTTWYDQFDIDYDLDDTSILYNFDPSYTTVLNASLLGSFLKFKSSLSGNLYQKSYVKEEDQSDLLTVYKWNKSTINNDLSVTMNLLELLPEIERSTFTFKYNLDTQLYKKSFDSEGYVENGSDKAVYKIENFDWNKESIDKHLFSTEYKYSVDFSNTTLKYQMNLPPLDIEKELGLTQNFNFDIFSSLKNSSVTKAAYEYNINDDTSEEIISLSEVYTLNLFDITGTGNFGLEYSESFIDVDEGTDEWDYDPLKFSLSYKLSDFANLNFSTSYSLEDDKWDSYSGALSIWDFDFKIKSSYKSPIKWNKTSYVWESDSSADNVLKLDTITFDHDLLLKNRVFWKNRVTLNINSDLSISKSFIKVDESYLKYALVFDLDIYEFLTFKFTSTSINSSLFQYWQSDINYLGLGSSSSKKNIFTDLYKSFNFLSDSDRKESSFKLKSIELDAIYKMPDWNLVFNYTGEPQTYVDTSVNQSKIKWYQVFSIFIEWKPLSIVRSEVVNDDENWSVSTSAEAE